MTVSKMDFEGLTRNRMSWVSGDYIQPMVRNDDDTQSRRTLRVLARVEKEGMLGLHLEYLSVDKHGKLHWVWVMDDPRYGWPADSNEEDY